jgi:hypothetical protein
MSGITTPRKKQHPTRINSAEFQPFEPQITRVIREKKERIKATYVFYIYILPSSEKVYSLCAWAKEILTDLVILLRSVR